MAISLLPTSPSRNMTPAAFTAAMDAWIAALPGFVSDANNLAANLNSIAAGGAYAIPYIFDGTSGSAGDPGSGKLRLSGLGTQSISTAMYLNTVNSLGAGVAPTLATFDDSTSTIAGVLRLYKQGDASKWLRFSVTAVTAGAYYTLTMQQLNGSASSPFVNGDALMLDFQRTGDKGDIGPTGVSAYTYAHVREEQAAGTNGAAPASVTTGTYRRTLNVMKYNTAGASLASNQVTLSAGTYEVVAFATASFNGASTSTWHRLALYDVTGATYLCAGPSAQVRDISGTADYLSGNATMVGVFALSTQKAVELRHLTPSLSVGGAGAVGLGSIIEVYTDLYFRKIG